MREGSRAPTRHSGLRAASQGITAAKLASAAVSRRGLLPSTSIDGALVRACLHDFTAEMSPKKTMSQAYMRHMTTGRINQVTISLGFHTKTNERDREGPTSDLSERATIELACPTPP